MSSTVLRLGLWLILLVLALYVVHETYEASIVAEYVSYDLLAKAISLGGILVVVGIILRLVERGAKKLPQNRCQVCHTPVPPGAIYCRAHLRRVLAREDDKTHMTRVRR